LGCRWIERSAGSKQFQVNLITKNEERGWQATTVWRISGNLAMGGKDMDNVMKSKQ
jgi:hypothetical protein